MLERVQSLLSLLAKIKCGESAEKKEPSYTVGRNVNFAATMVNSPKVP